MCTAHEQRSKKPHFCTEKTHVYKDQLVWCIGTLRTEGWGIKTHEDVEVKV